MKAQTKSKFITYCAAAGIALSAVLLSSVSEARNHLEFMPPGDAALPPSGWLQFCQTYRTACETSPLPARTVVLDEQTWRQLKRVNDWVNRNVTPMTDMAHYGIIQWWRYPDDGAGACHSYALLKQRLLMQAGWPRQALLMTVVREHNGEGHAVLTVRTSEGDFILDNLTDRIKLWSNTGYQYIEHQSQSDPNWWVGIPQPTAGSTVQPDPPAAEQVAVVPKPVKWPAWSGVEVADSSDQIIPDAFPVALVDEVVPETDGFQYTDSTEAHEPSGSHTSTAKPTAAEGGWSVQLIGSSSESSALAVYRRLQETYANILGSHQPVIVSTNVGLSAHWFRVRLAAHDRNVAESLCNNLRAAGGSCLVQRG